MVRPKARVRPALEIGTRPPPPPVPHGLALGPQQCARCRRHLAAKHEPREVTVWGLANRPMKVVMCADCAATAAAAH